MTEKPRDKAKPDTTSRAEAERAARQDREAAALRENLRKRKAQARAREKPDETGDQTAGST